MLTEKQMLHEPVLYLSLFFKKHRRLYYDRLNGTRSGNGWNQWSDFFLQGVCDTANQAVQTAIEINKLFRADKDTIEQFGRSARSALAIYQLAQATPMFLDQTRRRQVETQLSYGVGSCRAVSQSRNPAGIEWEAPRPLVRLREVSTGSEPRPLTLELQAAASAEHPARPSNPGKGVRA